MSKYVEGNPNLNFLRQLGFPKALDLTVIESKLVLKTRTAFLALAKIYLVSFHWILAHLLSQNSYAELE